MVTDSLNENSRAEVSADETLKSFVHGLYFFVCATVAGPQAGLFKLGISSHLAARYRNHTGKWDEFDLTRSALVRAESRDEVVHLEKTLRRTFGAFKLESMAKASSRTLTSEELIAAGSCRRYPGECADGWTEFYTVECLDKMLDTAEHLLERRRECNAGAYLLRGITPADLAEGVDASGNPAFILDHGPGSRKRKQALRQQELNESDELVEAKLGEVLDFALAHEDELRWVNLSWWRYLRFVRRVGWSYHEGLVDLYFDPVGYAGEHNDPEAAHKPAAQLRFEESFARIDPVAAPVEPRRWRWTRPEQVCSLRDLLFDSFHQVPHPICARISLLRVEPVLSNLYHPVFEQFEALAQRVEGRLVREQMEFF